MSGKRSYLAEKSLSSPKCEQHGICSLCILCQRCGFCMSHCVCPPPELRRKKQAKKRPA